MLLKIIFIVPKNHKAYCLQTKCIVYLKHTDMIFNLEVIK